VWSITTRVESIRRRSLWVDLAVFLYLFGTGTAVLFSVGWTMAPFENTEPNTAHDAALVGLALTALATAWAMARAVWRDDLSSARILLLASVVSLAIWALALPP
jgi:hypothetical protein